jgi:histidine ammonia-lyase
MEEVEQDRFVIETCDKLGQIKAQIAELQKVEEKLKQDLIATGIRTGEGELFRVTVSRGQRETLDMEAVREKAEPSVYHCSHQNHRVHHDPRHCSQG